MRLLLLSLLTCFVFGLNAQANWQPGYIIQNGQKEEGEIDDREWPYGIDEFRFRTAADRPATTYAPTNIGGFGLDGRKYESAEVNYISNSRELDKISRDTVLNRKIARVFLRQYYGGALSLYQYVDATDKRHFYVQREDGPLEYLEYELRLRNDSGVKKVKYLENYKYQFAQVIADCPSIAGEVSTSPYTLKALTKVVKSYYNCKGEQPTYTARVNQGTISFGGLVGILQTTPTGQQSESGSISTEAATGPAFGVGARYVFPGAREKFAAKTEVLYHSFDDAARLQNRSGGSSSSTIIRRDFSASTVQLHLLAEVQLLTGKTSVYAEAGLAASYLLDSDQSQTQITVAPDGTETRFTEDLNIEVNMTNELGWLAGVGARRGPFQLGLRASRVTRLKGNSGIGFIRAGVLAGYWF